MKVAAVIDSRNVFHQTGDVCGARGLPTVSGVEAALGRYGLNVARVHVGLALPRPRDQTTLSQSGADNEGYRQQILSQGGDVLLGELHLKGGRVEEKMVDVACTVRVTRYVEEIMTDRTDVKAVVVLSKDSDLTPAYEHARNSNVPVIVAAADVIQHRGHPFLFLGPHAYAEMCPQLGLKSGHEIRSHVAQAVESGAQLPWEVVRRGNRPFLRHLPTGMVGVPSAGIVLPPTGGTVDLYPVDVVWDENILGKFPLVKLSASPSVSKSWASATVVGRANPLAVSLKVPPGCSWRKGPYPLGGVGTGDTVLIHLAEQKIIGPLVIQDAGIDRDTPCVVRVVKAFDRGGALAVDDTGRRGLINTNQKLVAGAVLPVVQLDQKPNGPVWAAIGSRLPS